MHRKKYIAQNLLITLGKITENNDIFELKKIKQIMMNDTSGMADSGNLILIFKYNNPNPIKLNSCLKESEESARIYQVVRHTTWKYAIFEIGVIRSYQKAIKTFMLRDSEASKSCNNSHTPLLK